MVVTWRETKVLLTSLAKRKATAPRLPRVNVAFIAILVSTRSRFNFPGDRGIPVENDCLAATNSGCVRASLRR